YRNVSESALHTDTDDAVGPRLDGLSLESIDRTPPRVLERLLVFRIHERFGRAPKACLIADRKIDLHGNGADDDTPRLEAGLQDRQHASEPLAGHRSASSSASRTSVLCRAS